MPGQGHERMDRRKFLKVGAASVAAGYLTSTLSETRTEKESAGQVAKRRLGRTDLHVSIVGFSGCRLIDRAGPPLSQETADRMVAKALEYGINLVDTAYAYGRGHNENTLRKALGARRKEVIIFSRLPYGFAPRGRKSVTEAIEGSLKRLGTDHIELCGFHGKALSEQTAERFIQDELPEYVKAKREGKIGYIGASGHLCTTGVLSLLKTGEMDVIEVPVSPVRREFLEMVIPVAKKMGVGVISMKALTGYTGDLGCFAKPSAELMPIFGRSPEEFYRRVLWFSLAQDVSSVLVGTQSVQEVEASAKAALAYRGLSEDEKKAMRFGAEKEAKDFCRVCNVCLPCPEGIDVPGVLRLEINARLYGLEKWAKLEYRRRKFNASACTKCGRCTERCPYGVPAKDLVLKAAETLA